MAKADQSFSRYGVKFPAHYNDLDCEFYCIQKGGKGVYPSGKEWGLGLFEHYKRAMTLLWPEDDWHRWAELALREIVANKVTCLMGPQNSNKTYSAAKFALCDYFCFPHETCVLVSSTDVRGLELRVWGTIKGLYNRATDRYSDLAGNIIDSLHAIATNELNPESIEERKKGRVLNKGIICIPCLQSGRYVGLGKYVGIKSKRIVFVSDECQCMGPNFLDAVSNIGGARHFKFIPCGNPIDPTDPLGLCAEPRDGWGSLPESEKTRVWETKFLQGKCVNFVGFDSPNFDFPVDQPPKFPYLIHRQRIEEVAAFWGKDSQRFWEQCGGIMKTGLLCRRIITRDMCREHHALEKALWLNTDHTKIYAIDAAYSGTGGDRCVGGWGEFGTSIDGVEILRVNNQTTIPISIISRKSPEDQIAEYVKKDTEQLGIPSENIFYDSTGRGTLGPAFAKVFGERPPVPVEFGGKPSARPVRHDLFISDGDERRHVRCDEYYIDFVSELWFSSMYLILCNQCRELPEETMAEGCKREYGRFGKGSKYFIESKHDKKARERMVRSPDLYDQFVTLIEGARQRGFKILRLGAELIEKGDSESFFETEAREYQDTIRGALLQHI
jgi:hypothetical protein